MVSTLFPRDPSAIISDMVGNCCRTRVALIHGWVCVNNLHLHLEVGRRTTAGDNQSSFFLESEVLEV